MTIIRHTISSMPFFLSEIKIAILISIYIIINIIKGTHVGLLIAIIKVSYVIKIIKCVEVMDVVYIINIAIGNVIISIAE